MNFLQGISVLHYWNNKIIQLFEMEVHLRCMSNLLKASMKFVPDRAVLWFPSSTRRLARRTILRFLSLNDNEYFKNVFKLGYGQVLCNT